VIACSGLRNLSSVHISRTVNMDRRNVSKAMGSLFMLCLLVILKVS